MSPGGGGIGRFLGAPHSFQGEGGGTSRHQQSIKRSYGKLTANGGGGGGHKKYYRDLWGKCFSVTTNIVPTSPPLQIATTSPPPGNDYPLFHANTNTFLMNFYFSSCFGGGGSKGWGKWFQDKKFKAIRYKFSFLLNSFFITFLRINNLFPINAMQITPLTEID